MSFRSELPFRDTYPTLTCRDTSNHLTFNTVKMLRIEADAILSYSLGGLAFMALVSCAFVGFNTTAFPVEFYGIDRSFPAASQFFLAITALVGHLWHAYRAIQLKVES